MLLSFQPLWISGIVLGGLTALAMCGPTIVRRRMGLDALSTNNEVAGFKFATVGVLYAVLLAFAVIIVWEKFNDAESDVSREAGAVATVYRLADGIGSKPGDDLRDGVTRYLKTAIAEDWPAMEHGKESPLVTLALNDLYTELLTINPGDGRGVALFSEVLDQLNAITQARRARLVASSGSVPGVLWFVLFAGAGLTIGFTFFFGTENLRAQTMMTGTLSVLIFSGLLIIIAIDHPFSGSVRVEPDALSGVLDDFGRTGH